MKTLLRKYLQLLRGRDKGAVAISFMLSLPILMSVIGVLVQFALLVNARLTVERAAAAAARSAMTAFPTDPSLDNLNGMDGANFVDRSARMALEGISPVAQTGETPEATDIAASLKALGVQPATSYPQHYTYAQAATSVEWTRLDANDQPISNPAPWTPANFAQARGQRLKITVHYKFFLSVPGIRTLIGVADNVAGVDGRFVTFTCSCIVQTSPGRETGTDNNGWPN